MLNRKTTPVRLLFAIPLVIAALLIVSTASAHPNGHIELTMSQLIGHMFASPFHTGIIVVTIIASSFLIRLLFTKKSNKRLNGQLKANKPE